jgi:hypothetical protein
MSDETEFYKIEQLEYYKKKCEVLEKDLFKVQMKNKKNEETINKMQKMLSVYGKNVNNTSNSFMLPSEFKSNWESLAKEILMEAFDNIYDDYTLLANSVQDSLLIIYEEARSSIRTKITIVLSSLNIGVSDSMDFIGRFRSIFQEYFTTIFQCEEGLIEAIKRKFLQIVETYSITDRKQDLLSDVDSIYFKKYITHCLNLCVYIHLHEPKISLNIQPFSERELKYNFYNKSDYLNIEGFAKDSAPCLMILPPPVLRSNFSYQGIKPAVYILKEYSDKIMSECEKNKPVITKQRSYSSSDSFILCAEKTLNKDRHNTIHVSMNNTVDVRAEDKKQEQKCDSSKIKNKNSPYDHPLIRNNKKDYIKVQNDKGSAESLTNKVIHHIRNPSRNSSVLESFNSSLNRDSARTNEYQHSARFNKVCTPIEIENIEVNNSSERQNSLKREIIVSEGNLNNISKTAKKSDLSQKYAAKYSNKKITINKDALMNMEANLDIGRLNLKYNNESKNLSLMQNSKQVKKQSKLSIIK